MGSVHIILFYRSVERNEIEINYRFNRRQISESIGFSSGVLETIPEFSKNTLLLVIVLLFKHYPFNLKELIDEKIPFKRISDNDMSYEYTLFSIDYETGVHKKNDLFFDETMDKGKINIENRLYFGVMESDLSCNFLAKVNEDKHPYKIRVFFSSKIKNSLEQDIIPGTMTKIYNDDKYCTEPVILVDKGFSLLKRHFYAITYYLIDDGVREFVLKNRIIGSSNLIDLVGRYIENNKYFSMELPEELSVSYFQYLNYFSKYVKKTKGKDVVFNYFKKNGVLCISFKGDGSVQMHDIKGYLQEYSTVMTASSIELSDVVFEQNITSKEINLFLLELRNQNRFLRSSLEIAKLENKELNVKIDKLLNIDGRLYLDKSVALHKSNNNKDYFNDLIKGNRIEECIDKLCHYLDLNDDGLVMNELIFLRAKYYNIEKKFNQSLVSHDEYQKDYAKILLRLLAIIKERIRD